MRRVTGTLHEDRYTFNYNSLISSWNEKCLRKKIVEKIKTYLFYVE